MEEVNTARHGAERRYERWVWFKNLETGRGRTRENGEPESWYSSGGGEVRESVNVKNILSFEEGSKTSAHRW